METPTCNLDTIGNVVPKRNNGLMTHCYFWVGSASVLPKCNNGLMTHCYFWVQSTSILPKCNIGSLIHFYAWVRQKPIGRKLHVYPINFHFRFHFSSKCLKCPIKVNIFCSTISLIFPLRAIEQL